MISCIEFLETTVILEKLSTSKIVVDFFFQKNVLVCLNTYCFNFPFFTEQSSKKIIKKEPDSPARNDYRLKKIKEEVVSEDEERSRRRDDGGSRKRVAERSPERRRYLIFFFN